MKNAEPGSGNFSLLTGTTHSINAFYVSLEQRVGLCNVVKMAARLGVTKADGRSLFRWGDGQNLLREALLIADHTAYHLGELVVLRRLLGAWNK